MSLLENRPEVSDAMSEIRKMTEDTIVKITEEEFKSKILPFLTYNGDEPINLGYWADIAGSVLFPIHVVKGNNILFTVPPICKSPSFTTTRASKESVFEIVATAKLKSEVVPRLGEEYLDIKLTEKLKQEGYNIEELKAWDSILKRYGHKGLFSKNQTTNTSSIETTGEDIFDGQYDEL